jgi:chromosome segregation ATPase
VTGAEQNNRDSRLRERSSKELDRIAKSTKKNEVDLAHYKKFAKIYCDQLNAQDAEVRRLKSRVNKLLAKCSALKEKVQDYNDGMTVPDWL